MFLALFEASPASAKGLVHVNQDSALPLRFHLLHYVPCHMGLTTLSDATPSQTTQS